ncbi:hypothetical protein EsDP_00001184 [Epichloe bromicola]|uniref:Uncharacterized protein n=1 Tax=Epichloe bromicola TaxID=79588 RepID=A0ABQ0CHK9_9HYPO
MEEHRAKNTSTPPPTGLISQSPISGPATSTAAAADAVATASRPFASAASSEEPFAQRRPKQERSNSGDTGASSRLEAAEDAPSGDHAPPPPIT